MLLAEAREDVMVSETHAAVSVILFLFITFSNIVKLMLIHSSGLENIEDIHNPTIYTNINILHIIKIVLK